MKTASQFFFRAWRPAVLLVSLALLAYLLYFHRLGSLLPGYAPSELRAYQHASTWRGILHDPVNAPYKVLLLAFILVGHHSLVATRMAAAAFGVTAVVMFFFIVRAWYSFRIAFLSTVLFATSAGFLHVARLGSPQILQMGILALVGILLWHRQAVESQKIYLSYLVVIILGILWYAPGMLWLEVFAAILLWRRAVGYWVKSSLVHQASWVLLFLLLVAPLVVSIALHPELGLRAAGLPASVHILSHTPTNLLHAVLSIGIRSDGSAVLWVGHAPLLNAIELALGALGAYYYLYHTRSVRSLLLAGSMIICLVLIGLGGGTGIACLVPLLYLFIAGGLDNLVGQWLTVFPRNPIARVTGIALVCIMLFFSVLYQTRSYFVAWPHATATQQAFDIRQP